MPLYTEKPKRSGELAVVDRLEGMGDPRLHIWCNLDYIPGVRDNDLILWHETVGVFSIEIKAVQLGQVLEFGYRSCLIEGRPCEDGPQYQADKAAWSLHNYLSLRVRQLPFVIATACWPLISRETWNRRWNDKRVTGGYAERMLFQEDLCAGPSVLRKRLEKIWYNPPVKAGSNRAFVHSAIQFKEFSRELTVDARPIPTASDLARLRLIEKEHAELADSDVLSESGLKMLYSGKPGTGKTFRLLRIGVQHALSGKRVLFACFNKVLAADLRRILGYSERLRLAAGELVVSDVFEILSAYSAQEQLIELPLDHETWAAAVTDTMLARSSGGSYQTVLVDEAQDLHDWAFRMLEWQLQPAGTLCVAVGKGQELYGGTCAWLQQFEREAKQKPLRRNFRNTKPVFQVSQTAYESGLDPARVAKTVEKLNFKSLDADQLRFDREEGQWPLLPHIDDEIAGFGGEADPFYAQRQHEHMVAHYEKILRSELDALAANQWPQDLLVLVPSESHLQRDWAIEAARNLGETVHCLDYTNPSERRLISRPSDVRVCTFHSSRGIEGIRVVIFGIEHLLKVARMNVLEAANLAYIVLSRSIAECVIVVPKSQSASLMPRLLGEIISALQARANTVGVTHPEPAGSAKGIGRRPKPSPADGSDGDSRSLLSRYPPGAAVSSPAYGRGAVRSATLTAAGLKLTIDFSGQLVKLQVPPATIERVTD